MDSLLHDVRNPLNAMSIHLEVLAEKLKAETGSVPPSQEKNLRAMREQIQRVDGILRRFNDFIVARSGAPGEVDLSDVATRAVDVLGHESRKRRLKVATQLEPGVKVRIADTGELGFLVVQALMRAFGRAETGTEVKVTVRAEGPQAVLEVLDGTNIEAERTPEPTAALELRCGQLGVECRIHAGECRLFFPRV
jgi:signal transduction histidine kinase